MMKQYIMHCTILTMDEVTDMVQDYKCIILYLEYLIEIEWSVLTFHGYFIAVRRWERINRIDHSLCYEQRFLHKTAMLLCPRFLDLSLNFNEQCDMNYSFSRYLWYHFSYLNIHYSHYSIGPFTLAKTQICTVYTARKTHNIQGFWHEKRMREKNPNLILVFWWCACATSLFLWPYTCSAHYVAGRGRVIPLKVTYNVTKNPNNTLRDWSRRLHWHKTPETPAEFQKNPTPEVGFSIRVFCSV